MTDVEMPRLSDSMEQGTILKWLIEEGQEVRVGDELVEIETDKAAMTYAAEVEGALSILVAEGETVSVGEVIARVGVRSEPDELAASPEASDGPRDAVESRSQPHHEVIATADGGTNGAPDDPATLVTPVARRLASIHGIALAELRGTGPRGRITKADVLAGAGVPTGGRVTPEPSPRPVHPGPRGDASPPTRFQSLTRAQQQIARRMAESKATIPHFQVQAEVVMDRALAVRQELGAAIPADAELLSAPSVNDLIVKASALALVRHPKANGQYRGDRYELLDRVNVGIAVAGDEVLVVPTIFDADTKSLGKIAYESRRLAERVRAGEITPPELSGATFTVSNLGMFGMTAIFPVINPPQSAILGVGAIRSVVAREGEAIVDRTMMTLTLSCDHRMIYGADAARFLAEIKQSLESPLRLCI